MANEVFLDSGYAIALAAGQDRLHLRAEELSRELELRRTRIVTTQAVLLEIGNALSKQRYRQAAAELLRSLEVDNTVEIMPLTSDLYAKAFHLFQTRPDKEWGLTDCVSFVVMQDRGLTDALSADAHYEQAGFRALLLAR